MGPLSAVIDSQVNACASVHLHFAAPIAIFIVILKTLSKMNDSTIKSTLWLSRPLKSDFPLQVSALRAPLARAPLHAKAKHADGRFFSV